MTNSKLCFWHNEFKCQSCLLIFSNLHKPPDDYTVTYANHDLVAEWTKYLRTVKELKNKETFEAYKKELEKCIKEVNNKCI